MNIRVKEGNADIYAVMALSTLFLLLVLLLPDLSFLRLLIGIPFLIFFPGYLLTSFLYPWKNEDNITEDGISGQDGEEKNKPEKRKPFQTNKSKEMVVEIDTKKARKIDGPTRLALSFAFSLAITPLVAFFMNEMYKVDPSIFGIRLLPMLITEYAVIMVLGGLSLLRRWKVRPSERFAVGLKIGPLTDGSLPDLMITSVLIIAIIIAAGVGVYLYTSYHENEKYTEFYILGPDRKIADYPDLFNINEDKSLFIGINNHEFDKIAYTISIHLNDIDTVQQILDFENMTITPERRYNYNVTLSHKGEFFQGMKFNIDRPGDWEMRFDLLMGHKVHRSLKLNIKVFEEGDILRFDNGTRTIYLTGPDGIPSNFDLGLTASDPFQFEITFINLNQTNAALNISAYLDGPNRWENIQPPGNLTYIENGKGAFTRLEVGSRNIGRTPFNLLLPPGDWSLYINVQGEGRIIQYIKTIQVV
ncbi:MAG: DUF1616 domain-containing protein [Candidatus Thermoplasmatota archaeon]|nr:DUF1616 domain-containing protein [Candidatus Thermoplasmatota archaeon]